MTERADVLVVGGGHAGSQVAAALRQAKFTGSITIVGDEQALPYERPALSKDYLAGAKSFEEILSRPADFWQARAIFMRLGVRVTAVDPVRHEVTTSDGAVIAYGVLVWAAGGMPRRLSCSGHDLAGVHTVRNCADVDRLVAELPDTRRVAVIGGGYIGLEAAAVLSKMGRHVTIFEALDRVLARGAGAPLSRFYEAEHRRHGVDVRLDAATACIEETNGRASGVRLENGEILPAEMVIVGIGIIPAVGPLIDAGAQGGNGVAVDARCRTTLPDIFAIGDCALHVNRFAAGAAIRLESVQNATDQAQVVAREITGAGTDYDAVPWFWSQQYDLKLQTVGLSTGHEETVLRGDPDTRRFTLAYLRAGRVIALDCVNTPRDFVHGKRLVVEGRTVAPETLADPSIPLTAM